MGLQSDGDAHEAESRQAEGINVCLHGDQSGGEHVFGGWPQVGLPFILRRFETFRKAKAKAKIAAAGASSLNSNSSAASDNGSVKKRVVFEDEKERGGLVERQFLDSVREEARGFAK